MGAGIDALPLVRPDPVAPSPAPAEPEVRRSATRRVLLQASNLLLSAYLAHAAYSAVASGSDVWLPVRLLEAASAGVMALLVLFRSAPVAARFDALAIAAVVVSNGHGFAFDDAPRSPLAIETAGRVVLAAAAAWGSVSRLYLGRNFAILPALRELRTRGPYSV